MASLSIVAISGLIAFTNPSTKPYEMYTFTPRVEYDGLTWDMSFQIYFTASPSSPFIINIVKNGSHFDTRSITGPSAYNLYKISLGEVQLYHTDTLTFNWSGSYMAQGFYEFKLNTTYKTKESESYAEGFNTGYDGGYNAGYQVGYTDGTTLGGTGFSFDWLIALFEGVNKILQVEIFPKFKLWYCIAIPLMISLVFMILKIFR